MIREFASGEGGREGPISEARGVGRKPGKPCDRIKASQCLPSPPLPPPQVNPAFNHLPRKCSRASIITQSGWSE